MGQCSTVPLVYVTGISGSGKSAVRAELCRRGFDAHDTDEDDNAVWVNLRTGASLTATSAPSVKPESWLDEWGWCVVREKVVALEQRASAGPVFLCGTTSNDADVWDLFSRVVYLAIDEQTLRDRIASRTSNDFGKAPHELAAILGWHRVNEDDHRRFGAVVVDGTLPLDDVVDRVLDAST